MGYSTAKKIDVAPNPPRLTKRLFLRWLMWMSIFVVVLVLGVLVWNYVETSVHVKQFLGYEFGQKCAETTDHLKEPWCGFTDVTTIPYHGSLMTLQLRRKIYGVGPNEARDLAEVLEEKYGIHLWERWSHGDMYLEYRGRKTRILIFLYNEGDYHYRLTLEVSDTALLDEWRSECKDRKNERMRHEMDRLD